MAIIKNEFPVLEYDDVKIPIILPNRNKNNHFPVLCFMTYFGEVLELYLKNIPNKIIGIYRSEMREFPIWEINYKGFDICLVQAVVGSSSIAMMTDFLYGGGVKKIILSGSCGVLSDIVAGHVIIPTTALRDEGTSYKYLPPHREIQINIKAIDAIKSVLEKENIKYITCKTWTTDAFYMETKDMVNYRKLEGCMVVEMECAAIASVAEYRGMEFGQLLYSGDIVSNAKAYDDRKWYKNISAREKLFSLSLEVLYGLGNNI
jgi:uridine phosphorylase